MLLFVAPEQEPVQSTAPLFTERCPAGFPSPAADYTEEELDLNAYCIRVSVNRLPYVAIRQELVT